MCEQAEQIKEVLKNQILCLPCELPFKEKGADLISGTESMLSFK